MEQKPWSPHGLALLDFFRGEASAAVVVHDAGGDTEVVPAGVFFREPDKWRNDGVKNPETLLLGTYADVAIWVGPVGLTYGALDFLDDPKNRLPGVAFRQALTKGITVKASATHNHTTKKMMWWMGFTYAK